MLPNLLFHIHFRRLIVLMLLVCLGATWGGAYAQIINTSNTVYLIAGSLTTTGSSDGTGANTSFTFPTGVVKDPSGNLYIADTINSTIRKITPAGVVITVAGSPQVIGSSDGVGSGALFNLPTGMVFDAAGNLYIADSINNTIRKMNPAGVVSTLAGTALVTGTNDGVGPAAQFNSPTGMTIDSSGNLYVADSHNNAIRKITPTGVVTTFAGIAGAPDGARADGTGAAAGFYSPSGLAIDSSDNLYVSDTLNNTIRKITPARVVTTLAGAVGIAGYSDGTGSSALFNFPLGLAADASGNLYVADASNNVIRKVTSAGVVTTVAGIPNLIDPTVVLGSLAVGQLNFPVGVLMLNANQLAITLADQTDSSSVLGINFNTVLPPLTVIQNITDYFNAGIASGGLVAKHPALKVVEISAFKLSLLTTYNLIKKGKTAEACQSIAISYALTSNQKNNVLEIIRGAQACNLQSQIGELSVQLGCPALPSRLKCTGS